MSGKYTVGLVDHINLYGGMHFYNDSLFKRLDGKIDVDYYTVQDVSVCGDNVHKSFGKSIAAKSSFMKFYSLLLGFITVGLSRSKIIHMHVFNFDAIKLVEVLIYRVFGKKIVATIHDVDSITRRKNNNLLRKLILRWADSLVVHGDVAYRELGRITNKKISIIELGNFTDYRVDEKAFEKSGDFNILFFGKIKETKRLDILVNAFVHLENLTPRFNTIKLKVAGVPDYDISDLVSKTAKLDNVEFDLSYISDSTVIEFIQSSDLVVLPYEHIYQSGVLLFAMSLGTPAIVSNVESFTSVVTDGVNGFVFDQQDHVCLAHKLLSVIDLEAESLDKISSSAYQYVDSYHSWEAISSKFIVEYEGLCKV